MRRGQVIVRRFSAVRGMWISGVARRGVLRLRVGGRAASHGRVTMRSGGRVSGRLGGRRVRVRLPGYGGASSARAGSGSSGAGAPGTLPAADAALASVFRAPFVAKSPRSRLVPSPAR